MGGGDAWAPKAPPTSTPAIYCEGSHLDHSSYGILSKFLITLLVALKHGARQGLLPINIDLLQQKRMASLWAKHCQVSTYFDIA